MLAKYQLIVLDVLTQIEDGTLKPGQALPSSRALAAQLEVSGGTVRAAMLVLKAHGVVYGKQGSALFVSQLGPHTAVAAVAVAQAAPPVHKRAIVVADIRARIARGDFAPGDRLDTYAVMKAHYGVSVGVIRDALLVLKAEGDVGVFESGVFESGVRVAQPVAAMPG